MSTKSLFLKFFLGMVYTLGMPPSENQILHAVLTVYTLKVKNEITRTTDEGEGSTVSIHVLISVH